jgi:hypothetical protein
LVNCTYSKYKRSVEIVIGEIYKVEPLNPLKKKYRDEKVKLIKHEPFGEGTFVLRLDSKWHVSRNSYTEIHVCDLVLIK